MTGILHSIVASLWVPSLGCAHRTSFFQCIFLFRSFCLRLTHPGRVKKFRNGIVMCAKDYVLHFASHTVSCCCLTSLRKRCAHTEILNENVKSVHAHARTHTYKCQSVYAHYTARMHMHTHSHMHILVFTMTCHSAYSKHISLPPPQTPPRAVSQVAHCRSPLVLYSPEPKDE